MSIESELIDVYIPSYNCQNQIVKVLDKINPHKNLFNNIFVIDNCSLDQTVNYAKQQEKKL